MALPALERGGLSIFPLVSGKLVPMAFVKTIFYFHAAHFRHRAVFRREIIAFLRAFDNFITMNVAICEIVFDWRNLSAIWPPRIAIYNLFVDLLKCDCLCGSFDNLPKIVDCHVVAKGLTNNVADFISVNVHVLYWVVFRVIPDYVA